MKHYNTINNADDAENLFIIEKLKAEEEKVQSVSFRFG